MINTTVTSDLNLARKWRPKDFSSIIGQDISIRMLKNSLYLKKFFPVYLFAGQRGCGKTSTARVFAAAVNCQKLGSFQQDPTIPLPCLSCQSCLSMLKNHHPDFIEIDAASHTGVDNVRQIIDASSYMPQFGPKKIYLIDEAHMLSKAAFNALLKILEEPPMTVLFILATTEIHKVPETILSRCFHVVFSPIENHHLKNHLQQICQQEHVEIDNASLDLILAETEGSARDAINLIERVRFSGDQITEETVLKVLGKISNKTLLTLFDYIVGQRPHDLLLHLQSMAFETLSPTIVWDMIISFTRILLWTKYGIKNLSPAWAAQKNDIAALAEKCSLTRLHAIMQLLWNQEELFIKTNKKHAFLEMTLVQLCEQVNLVDLAPLLQAVKNETQLSSPTNQTTPEPQNTSSSIPDTTTAEVQLHQQTQASPQQPATPWDLFLEKITSLKDPLLHSIFFQAKMLGIHEGKTLINLQLSNNGTFFKDKIEECKSQWLVHLQSIFSGCNGFHFVDSPPAPITQTPKAVTPPPPPTTVAQTRAEQAGTHPPKKFMHPGKGPYASQSKTPIVSNLEPINVDDKEKWPLANLILSHFPGKMRKMKG